MGVLRMQSSAFLLMLFAVSFVGILSFGRSPQDLSRSLALASVCLFCFPTQVRRSTLQSGWNLSKRGNANKEQTKSISGTELTCTSSTSTISSLEPVPKRHKEVKYKQATARLPSYRRELE